MSRSFAFHPEARFEFREAVKFYESERRGVGLELSRAVRSAIDYVLEHPLSGSPAEAGTRRWTRRLVVTVPHAAASPSRVIRHSLFCTSELSK